MLGLFTCSWFIAGAQVSFSLNIGSQPAWGPVGYDHADYYYLPDADAYYDINGATFMYMEGGTWVSGPYLPGRYRDMDLYRAHKVVINERNPWMHNDRYRSRYHSYAGRHDQGAIRDSRQQKYWQNPGHPQHARWETEHSNGYNNNQRNVNYGNDNNRPGNNYDHNNNRGNINHSNDNNRPGTSHYDNRRNVNHNNDNNRPGDNRGNGNSNNGNEGRGNNGDNGHHGNGHGRDH